MSLCHTTTRKRRSFAGHVAGEVVIKPWTLHTAEGDILCQRGILYVPENRAKPTSRVIGIGFVRFKTTAAAPIGVPPIIRLADGPAQSFLFKCNGEDHLSGIPLTYEVADIKRYQAISDTIYLDQRGYSKWGEVLMYGYKKPRPRRSLDQRKQDEVAVAMAAREHFKNLDIDLSGYTIKELAADVNDLVTAIKAYEAKLRARDAWNAREINYDRVTLIGHSFGGQWAFATIRLFPEIVARAIIAGVEPLSCAYDMPSHVLNALRRQWADAETHAGLEDLPAGGIEGAVLAILTRLDERATLARGAVEVGRDDFRFEHLRPKEILAIYHERSEDEQYQEWAKSVRKERRKRKAFLPVIKELIDTSLGVTAPRLAELRTDPALDVLSQRDFEVAMATKGIWPTPDVGNAFRKEMPTDTPVLFVQGEWDTQTPLENLLQVQPYFVNSRTIRVTNRGHTVYQDLEATPMMAELERFIKSGSTTDLHSRFALPSPPGH